MTPKQNELLRHLIVAIERTGVSPSYDELAEALAIKSKSGIVRIVDGLVERGLVAREGGRNRNLVPTPAGHTAAGGSLLRNVELIRLVAELERRGFTVVAGVAVHA